MNIVISIKREYLPNNENAHKMSSLFSLPYLYNKERDYYLFSGRGDEDKLFIVKALPSYGYVYEDDREKDILERIGMNDKCFFIFHDKDIRNEEEQKYPDSYHTPFCKHEYEGHSYWLFQHVGGDKIYDLLTSQVMDVQHLVERIKRLLGI